MGGGKAGSAGPAVASLPDIKDMLPYEAAVDGAADLVDHGNLDEATDRLRTIIPHVPGHSKAHCFLAAALRNQSKFDEAAGRSSRIAEGEAGCR